jgi:hypothetical protein
MVQRDADPRAVIQAAGRLICTALGVGPEPDQEAGFTAAEAVALPLVVHVRAMAVGAAGSDPVAALRTYLERAGRLGSRERLECSREELGALASRLLHSPATMPAQPLPAAAHRALAPRKRRSRRLPTAAALIVAVAAGAFVLGGGALRSQPASSPKVAPPVATAPPAASVENTRAAAGAVPLQVPAFALSSAPPIRSVLATPSTACSPGARCALDLAITFQSSRTNVRFAWKLEIFDTCTGDTVERPGGTFVAQPGWSRIQVGAKVQVPAMKAPAIVVVTTAPSSAQSAPISIAPEARC